MSNSSQLRHANPLVKTKKAKKIYRNLRKLGFRPYFDPFSHRNLRTRSQGHETPCSVMVCRIDAHNEVCTYEGVDLQCASHVFFSHAILATYEDPIDVEDQC